MVHKFEGSILHIFSGKSLGNGTNSSGWSAPSIIIVTRLIAAGSINSSEMV